MGFEGCSALLEGGIVIQKPRFENSGSSGGGGGRPQSQQRPTGPRINERIRVPEVRVIDGDGQMLGVLSTDEARRRARAQNLDLVEVNPKAQPPVCKIMDHGKYKYEEKKRAAEAKKRQQQQVIKEIKLRPKTDEHDLHFKTNHVRRFLEEGNKVKLTVRFRGREITHPEQALKQLEHIFEMITDIGIVEAGSRMDGKTMTAIVAPRRK